MQAETSTVDRFLYLSPVTCKGTKQRMQGHRQGEAVSVKVLLKSSYKPSAGVELKGDFLEM